MASSSYHDDQHPGQSPLSTGGTTTPTIVERTALLDVEHGLRARLPQEYGTSGPGKLTPGA